MSKAKLAISLDEKTLREVDSLVARRVFPNRSRTIGEAIQEKLAVPATGARWQRRLCPNSHGSRSVKFAPSPSTALARNWQS